ncbi:CapA family protein [candidate division KSB1 bacterium]|nr:CapA family protein [candidate division KSB1 bacterium]
MSHRTPDTTVLIGGDVCPGRRNLPFFIDGDAHSLFNDLLNDFVSADLSMINLECPLIEKHTPIDKVGPTLGADSRAIRAIGAAGIDIVLLANNHIMDHGPAGLANTLNVLKNAKITTVGAGKNIEAARQVVIKKVNHLRIGLVAMAEHEFSIATENSAGANPLDLIEYSRIVRANRKRLDYLIVILHGGSEYYSYPSPNLKKTCRFLVETGANAVIVQHPHFPGCYEKYQDAYIVYGQGNLIFDSAGKDEMFYLGYLVKLSIAANLCATIDIIPYEQSKTCIGARGLQNEKKQLFMESLRERSARIHDDAFLMKNWLEFCETKRSFYLGNMFLGNALLRKLNKNGALLKLFKDAKSLLTIRHFISCETHQEAILTILQDEKIQNKVF